MKRALVSTLAAASLVVSCLATFSVFATDAPKKGAAPATKSEKTDCTGATKTAVALTGTVLCEHCDLHRASSCNPVFKAEAREGYLSFCPETKDVTAIKDAADHGKNVLEVKGSVCKTKDGKELLHVDSFSKKAAAKKAA